MLLGEQAGERIGRRERMKDTENANLGFYLCVPCGIQNEDESRLCVQGWVGSKEYLRAPCMCLNLWRPCDLRCILVVPLKVIRPHEIRCGE